MWEDRSGRINHEASGYIWAQVADDLRKEVRDGTLPSGLQLPAAHELADIYGVARGTILRAIRELTEEGILVITPHRGTFVA
ncbi:winged helix-turn-helix domain-containing protein [Amycolatopsis thermoflava]|uniref:winged helix-turn-helix domain-containing protein n=1 Tax=Amycolatopsis thermoflava TaxID=84480 RepID=UPI00056A7F89|nr:winged helix-turn-helix domain-containing protein [Amycolatopsis thermoflava]